MSEQAWPDPDGVSRATEAFRAAFDAAPEQVWASPGRVNLVGEHTDYNGGLALPIALPHRTFAAIAPRSDRTVRLVSGLDDGHRWEGTLDDIRPGGVSDWVAYCAGPAWALREDGVELSGFDLALASCVPTGAGLSSSAAVECAVALALTSLAGESTDDDAARARLAALCVRAENEVAGAPTGGMDQATSLRAKAGHALLLDCRDDSVEHVALDLEAAGLALLVVDTRVHHSLADGQYGRRRTTCETAAARLGVTQLGDLDSIDTENGRQTALARLDGEEARRARHVLTEIARVREVVDAARAQDWTRMGTAMDASHESLRVDYEVSCVELDVAVEAARAAGALGARMTGGGFGGSAIALVPLDLTEQVAGAVTAAARERGLREPAFHVAVPSASGERVA
ncbi:galactokinase [Mobilicoccus pelagius]|uniref:Galactokinase n=1 Tax=Mobilicoccus pelagius NBRC 104925 TaxID=1089455 RepID=H5URF3_9MICO|nr:galactokinase [Mobilicoccus pelagius]GAB48311.1 galactokinase [Mobilicoccus pelagius NBRC 104925]